LKWDPKTKPSQGKRRINGSDGGGSGRMRRRWPKDFTLVGHHVQAKQFRGELQIHVPIISCPLNPNPLGSRLLGGQVHKAQLLNWQLGCLLKIQATKHIGSYCLRNIFHYERKVGHGF